MATTIQMECVDQTLSITSKPLVASGGVGEDEIEFTLCSKWTGYTVSATFYRTPTQVYNVALTNNKCTIPHEMLQEKGVFYVGIYGTSGSTRRTSEVVAYDVTQGAIVTNLLTSNPNPTVVPTVSALFE